MFTLHYANDQQKIFNSNCHAVNLVNDIKSSCGFQNMELDIAEEGSGQLLFITENPLEYASNFIKPRSVYVPVQVASKPDFIS